MQRLFAIAMLACAALLPVCAQDTLLQIQMYGRHGARVPNDGDLYPGTEAFWESTGAYPGTLTRKGINEMMDLGRYLRRKYHEEEPLLPSRWNEKEIWVTSTYRTNTDTYDTLSGEGYWSRTVQSAVSLARGMYPEDVPVTLFQPQDRDIVTRGPENCASYNAEFPRIDVEYDLFLETNYGPFLQQIQAITGFNKTARDLVHAVESTLECSLAHNIESMLDPYLLDNQDLLLELAYGYFYTLYSPDGPADPRGTVGGGAVEEMIRDIRGLLDGTHERKATLHTGHRTTAASVYAAFDLGLVYGTNGFFFLQEFRQRADGTIYVTAYRLTSRELIDGTFDYDAELQPINCPTAQAQCDLDAWQDYLQARSGLGYTEGCCLIGQGFLDLGCDDYYNPATLDIRGCFLYRTKCPDVACGPGNYLDAGSNLCIPLGKTRADLFPDYPDTTRMLYKP